MRKFLTVVASVLVILVLLAPYADAQQTTAAGPSPKVTINGLIDNVTSWNRNSSIGDVNLSRVDKEWYARTRARPDLTAELGTTKFVLGLEIDYTWGSSCPSGTDVDFRCQTQSLGTPVLSAGFHNGTFSAADLNTDMPASIEIKWAYTEFALPGAPAGSILRLGAQPFTITHKLSALATGDFPGVHTTIALSPQIKLNFTYAQIEAANTGAADGFFRGNDFAIFTSADVSPFKGLDLRPIYSFAELLGNTSSSTRQSRGGLAASSIQQGAFPNQGVTGFTAANVGVAGAAPNFALTPGLGTAVEHRHTIGLDAKWTFGPFYLDPTVFYQWGSRGFVVPTAVTVPCTSPLAPPAGNVPGCVTTPSVPTGFPGAGTLQRQDMRAWLLDLTGGWRAGPLLLEGRVSYTTGNKANEDIRNAKQDVHFFQPIDTDAQWWAGWAEIQAVGVDYFNLLLGSDLTRGLSPAFAVGYDKYGLIRLGGRASYALTPAFTVRASVVPSWTAEKVDNTGIKSGGNGIIPGNIGRAISENGSRYLGTEADVGITWRFAPGLTFDLVGGYMWIGDGYKSALSTAAPLLQTVTVNGNPIGPNLNRPDTNPHDVSTIAARVRYSF